MAFGCWGLGLKRGDTGDDVRVERDIWAFGLLMAFRGSRASIGLMSKVGGVGMWFPVILGRSMAL